MGRENDRRNDKGDFPKKDDQRDEEKRHPSPERSDERDPHHRHAPGRDKTFRPHIRSDAREKIATIAATNPSGTRSWNLYHSGRPRSIERLASPKP